MGLPLLTIIWANRMKDHMMSKQPGWMRVFETVEAQTMPITNSMIQTYTEIDGVLIDVPWLSQHRWALICANVINEVHTHRVACAGGERYNGFEFWRRLFNDYQ